MIQPICYIRTLSPNSFLLRDQFQLLLPEPVPVLLYWRLRLCYQLDLTLETLWRRL